MEELKCPHCDSPVEIEECIDTEYYGDSIIRECYGFCVNCSTVLSWQEVFKLAHYDNIEIED